ncbi:MAG: YbaB/EbfC family nucleoid-associated protein [Candidatus Omnitrophica bacterium]|nr:YbaB/EbfC family nucleoid-associated protein [Candidatus Omnitrophota bacterium]MCM8769896.1 YbaB/EbfC family nucleoid-associated protein [Candidatus Omnitrophota bacterium]
MTGFLDQLKQLGQLKQQAAQFQKMLTEKVVEVSSPGGEVTIKVNGKMELLKVEFNPEVLSPEKKAFLESIFLRTWAKAQKEVERLVASELKSQIGHWPF